MVKAGQVKRSKQATLLKLSCLGVLLALFTACSSEPAPVIETEAQSIVQDFLVSKSANRSGATVLDSSAVAGRIYVFTAQTSGINQVEFYLDDVKRSGKVYQIDSQSPYDLRSGSTSSANALDTSKLSDGVHTVTARIRYKSGSEKISTATFLVDNGGKLGSNLLVSTAADRSGSKLLNNSSVNGKIHVFVVPTMSAKQVSFYLDNTSRSGNPTQKERIAFYDFAGTASAGGANSFDTSKLKDGQHTVTAAILTSSGRTQVVSATFTVGASNTSAPAPTSPATPNAPKAATGVYELRGNPNFSVNQLSAEQRKWYDTLWKVIKNPDQFPNSTIIAKSGNSYWYRGDLQDYVISLLLAFRMTGDLRLIDEVDRVAELMRGKLADGWYGTLDGKDGTKDGFLNWLDHYDTSTAFRGKDTQMAYDLKANALVAEIAWALQNNRDLKSPSGVDYGAHADFWKDYLVNHFEAKWRKRNAKPTGFPFLEHYTFHTYHSFMKWHHYMGKLTSSSAYTKEAERMATRLWDHEFKETPSSYGTALVWTRTLTYNTDTKAGYGYLMPQHYARYVVQEAIDLHFEGFSKYASDSTMEKIAHSVASFVIDDSSFSSFARDIGGGTSRAGLPASSPTEWSRMKGSRFAESAWAYLAPWDNSGKISKAAIAAYNGVEMIKYGKDPKRVFIPASSFLSEMLKK